jgi:hypothetical protein
LYLILFAPENFIHTHILSFFFMTWLSPEHSQSDTVDWTHYIFASHAMPYNPNLDAPVYSLPTTPSSELQIDAAMAPTNDHVNDLTGAHDSHVGAGPASSGAADQPSMSAQAARFTWLDVTCFGQGIKVAYHSMMREVRWQLDEEILQIYTAGFPGADRFVELCKHYFAEFHPVFPFVRKASFVEQAMGDWRLLLAVAAIGTRFAPAGPETFADEKIGTVLDMVLKMDIHGIEEDFDVEPAWEMVEPDDGEAPLLKATALDLIYKMFKGDQLLHSATNLLREAVFVLLSMPALCPVRQARFRKGRMEALECMLRVMQDEEPE